MQLLSHWLLVFPQQWEFPEVPCSPFPTFSLANWKKSFKNTKTENTCGVYSRLLVHHFLPFVHERFLSNSMRSVRAAEIESDSGGPKYAALGAGDSFSGDSGTTATASEVS